MHDDDKQFLPARSPESDDRTMPRFAQIRSHEQNARRSELQNDCNVATIGDGETNDADIGTVTRWRILTNRPETRPNSRWPPSNTATSTSSS